jgi:single-stranded-DNA-specific exonuclease
MSEHASDGCAWPVLPAAEDSVRDVGARTGLSELTSRILVARGYSTPDAVRQFLDPGLDRDWLDPELIPGMSAAADAVADHVRRGSRIVVFGDFDLDGISAASVASRGLLGLGADVRPIVPHRFREGYGLSEAALARVLEDRPDLLVTVDCGVSNAPEVAMVRESGVDVVVTDHHEPGDALPAEVPLANPKLDADCPGVDLAGAGVALKLVQAVGARFGDQHGWRELTDLATLGTVADVVPLLGENRALVSDGLARLRREPRVALSALATVAGVGIGGITSDQIAFGLAPRLNAAGRMADPAVALDLLMTDDPLEAERIALVLDEHNRARQAAEADLLIAASSLVDRSLKDGDRALVLAGEGWHEGVRGIVASRLAKAHGVPALLFSVQDGEARGSGRSSGRVDLFQAVSACSGLLSRFGGHAAAVGLSMPAEHVGEFADALRRQLDALPEDSFGESPMADASADLADVSVELGAELRLLAPFGHANPHPKIVVEGVFMTSRERVGRSADHLRFTAYDGADSVPAIAFRCPDIEALAGHEPAVDLLSEIEVDEWRGRSRAQLIVREVRTRRADPSAPASALVEDLFARADTIIAREEYGGIEDADSFHTKLAGVTFEGRQELISALEPGTPLRLVRQPLNEHDPSACSVVDPHGSHVGFLNRRLAAVLAPAVDAGVEYDITVSDVTGGEHGKNRGVNVLVERRGSVENVEEEQARRSERRAELSVLPADELDAELVSRLLGERALHDAQVRALAHLSEGESCLVVMATGRGKSLIFHLHAAREALRHRRASLFVFPLRALVADQSFHLTDAFSEIGLSVRTLTGETASTDRSEILRALGDGTLDVVLTTPEFLDVHAERLADSGRIDFVVVDEAHHVGLSRAGHRPAYGRLGSAIERLGGACTLAVTATADDDVAAAIRSTLGISSVVTDPTVRENLLVEDHRGIDDRDGYLAGLAARGGRAIVYVNSRQQSVRLARMLRKRVPDIAMRTAFYNGGMTRSSRHAVERAFREGDVHFVVATSAFGEGVNVPDVRHVVLYHLPYNDVEFNQMCGRAGRDGAASRVHLLFGERDARVNELILSSLAPSREDLATLYRSLKELQEVDGDGFEITNAELVESARRRARGFALDERGVSTALGIFRELGLVVGEGYGGFRRLSVPETQHKVDLESSVRYNEGRDEIEQFSAFKAWVLSAGPDQLLARFNRPILPSQPGTDR